MEVEAFLNLFDSYWFHLNLFQTKPFKPKKFPEIPTSNPEIPALPTIHTKIPFLEKITSNSPQKLSDSYSSPNSVLLTSKLQTIFSGKISKDFEDYSKSEKEKNPEKIKSKLISSPLNPEITNRSRRKKKGLSKSLSDLEFEELKGFMDLGFVFSEEDRDSRLVSIIPGLQKLGKNDDKFENNDNKFGNNSSMSRPYLSETWEVMEKKRKENSLLNWKVPDSNSHVQMKDYLRSWAHTVASTVR